MRYFRICLVLGLAVLTPLAQAENNVSLVEGDTTFCAGYLEQLRAVEIKAETVSEQKAGGYLDVLYTFRRAQVLDAPGLDVDNTFVKALAVIEQPVVQQVRMNGDAALKMIFLSEENTFRYRVSVKIPDSVSGVATKKVFVSLAFAEQSCLVSYNLGQITFLAGESAVDK